MIKTKIKTLTKKLEAAILAGDKALAQEKLKLTVSEINKAASKGVFHKNNAARKVARLSKAVSKMA